MYYFSKKVLHEVTQGNKAKLFKKQSFATHAMITKSKIHYIGV